MNLTAPVHHKHYSNRFVYDKLESSLIYTQKRGVLDDEPIVIIEWAQLKFVRST